MTAKLISSYEVREDAVLVRTPYADAVAEWCRQRGGKWRDGYWELSASRLGEVQSVLGRAVDDLVHVEVGPGHEHFKGIAQVRVGFYILAGRRGRDRRPDVYADLVAGTLPSSGGSVKSPAVNPSEDARFRLWVPRDFALARNLTIVMDPLAVETAADGPAPGCQAESAAVRMPIISGERAVKILEWCWEQLRTIDAEQLSDFEHQLLERLS